MNAETPLQVEQATDGYCGECGVEPCACALFAALDEGMAALALPTPTDDDVLRALANIWTSGAAQAFEERRAELQAKHGASARTDLSRPLALMAHDAKDSLMAVLDRVTGHPNAERLRLALNTLATAGALCLALHEKLLVSIGDGAGTEGESHG